MAAVGSTASHELGHIMNMEHDDAGESRAVTSSQLRETVKFCNAYTVSLLSQFLSGSPRRRVSTVCVYVLGIGT